MAFNLLLIYYTLFALHNMIVLNIICTPNTHYSLIAIHVLENCNNTCRNYIMF